MKKFEECIFLISQQDKEKDNNSKEFIIRIDDKGGEYLSSLINVISKRHPDGIDFVEASTIEYGDYLEFTKKGDIYIKEHIKYSSKYYSLVKDYYKIISLIKNLYKKDDKHLPYKECRTCPYYKSAINDLEKDIIFDGDIINSNKKVSIFNNFVKIGYNQYDLYNKKDKNFIDIDGIIYEVRPKKESLCSKLKKKCIKLCSE